MQKCPLPIRLLPVSLAYLCERPDISSFSGILIELINFCHWNIKLQGDLTIRYLCVFCMYMWACVGKLQYQERISWRHAHTCRQRNAHMYGMGLGKRKVFSPDVETRSGGNWVQEGGKNQNHISTESSVVWASLLCFWNNLFQHQENNWEPRKCWHRYISILYFSDRTIDLPVETAAGKDRMGKGSRNPLKHYF